MKISEIACFRHIKFQPDRAELRRFAIAMFVGFTVIASIAAWRANGIGTRVLVIWGIGVILAVCAFIPGLGRLTYLAVYLPTGLLGYVVSHVIMVLLFFLLFAPLGLILRLTGKDLLRLRPGHPRASWLPLNSEREPKSYYRQF